MKAGRRKGGRQAEKIIEEEKAASHLSSKLLF